MRALPKLSSLFVLLVVSLFPTLAQTAKATHSTHHSKTGFGKPKEEVKFSQFTVRTYRDDETGEGYVQILDRGRVVFSKHGWDFIIGNAINHDNGAAPAPNIPVGTDITGLGKPNLILNEWSGGAHCCITFYVLELGEPIRLIATIQADDSEYAHFEDVNHDGIYEFVGWDFAFKYWHTDFAQSPAPHIVLEFNGTRYQLALDLMQKPLPSTTELNKVADHIRSNKWTDGFPPPLLWGNMLDLIYTGHSERAWNFLNKAWLPSAPNSKKRFLRDFCGQMATSRYFPQLRSTLRSAPCEFNPRYGVKM